MLQILPALHVSESESSPHSSQILFRISTPRGSLQILLLSYHGAEGEARNGAPDTQAVHHDGQQQQCPGRGVDGDDGALLREETLGQTVASLRERGLRGAWETYSAC